MPWLRVWLACVASFYPLCWVSGAFLGAAPALVRAALFGHRLDFIQVWFVGVMVRSVPRNFSGDVMPSPADPDPDPVKLAVVVLLVLAIIARPRHSALGGLAIAMLGWAGLQGWPFRVRLLSFQDIRGELALEALLIFALLCFGLRRMLAGWIPQNYWARLATLLLTFSLPLGVMLGVFGRLRHYRFAGTIWLAWLIPGALASLVASWPPRRKSLLKPLRTGWKAAAVGLVASAVLGFGIPRLNDAMTSAWRSVQLKASRAEMATVPEIPADFSYPKLFFQKGVNFTADYPDTYTSERARQMLGLLRNYGVNAVALVPYGRSARNPPQVRVEAGANSWESDEGLEQLSRVAHHLGHKVLLKPHLGGRNEIDLPSAEDRARWFAQYTSFIEHYAQAAKRIHADLLCVGAEFVKLARYEAEWRDVIARVRPHYPGPLVYAANQGTEFETVAFWDALDYIGLENYYPLPDDLSTEEVARKVEAVAQKFQRPVIFTEAGFASLEGAHRQPWAFQPASPPKLSPEEQAHCYEAVFRGFYQKPWFQGVYWWNVGSGGSGGPKDGSHTPWGKPAMEVVRHWYRDGGR